jgi:hypothetical protein
MKTLRSKLQPEVSRESIAEGRFLREFEGGSGVLCREGMLIFTLKVHRMNFNHDLNFFDHEVLLSKRVALNPSAETLQEDKCLMLRVDSECFEGVEIDLYDPTAKQRLKYDLEIYA